MVAYNFDVYMPIIILLLFGAGLVIVTLLLGKLIRPHNPNKIKNQEYECGENPVGIAWSVFNVRFYVIALIFLIFDVESSLMFPVVTVFKSMREKGMGGIVLIEVLLFIFILLAGFAYCWRRGDLDWVKSYHTPKKDVE